MSKIIISGCSYSYDKNSYGEHLKKSGHDVISLSYPGLSNSHIIYQIYDYVTNNNIVNSNIIIQLTWLHRFGGYNTYYKKWVNYQPNFFNVIPNYNEKSDFIEFDINTEKLNINLPISKKLFGNAGLDYNEMLSMYSLYLKYHFDEIESFNYLLYQLDTITSFLEKTKNNFLLMYWPIIPNASQLTELKNRNFFNIDGEYSMLKWSTKNKFLDGESSHLSNKGHKCLGEKLNDWLI